MRPSNNVQEPASFQMQQPEVDGDEVHRQSKFREEDGERRNAPPRPMFRIGGSVIPENNGEAKTDPASSYEHSPEADPVAQASPLNASHHADGDLEKGQSPAK